MNPPEQPIADREANLLSALKLMVSKFDAHIDSEYCGTDLLAEQLAQADFAREVIREAEANEDRAIVRPETELDALADVQRSRDADQRPRKVFGHR